MQSVSFVNILGHSSVSTTQIYQDVMGETLVKDLIKVQKFSM